MRDQLIRGADDRPPALHGEHRADGLPLVGRELGVHLGVHPDLLRRDLERFRRHLADDAAQALPHLGAPHVDRDAAVDVHLHVAALGGERRALGRFHDRREAAPVIILVILRSLGLSETRSSDRVIGAGCNVAVGFPHLLAQGVDLAFAQVVDLTQLEGIHLQLAGQHVHHALGGNLGFLVPVAAVSAHRRRVGVDGIAGQLAVLELVRTGGVVGGSDGDVYRGIRIGPAGMQDGGFDRHQLAVLLGADLHLRCGCRGRSGCWCSLPGGWPPT